MHSLRRLFVPVLLLIVALWLRPRALELAPAYQLLLDWLPVATLGAAMVLSTFFNRGRLFTAALVLLAAYGVIQTQLQTALTEPRALLVFSLVSLAVPGALLLLLFVPERGLRNRHGGLLITLPALLLLTGWCVVTYVPGPALTALENWVPIKSVPGYVLSIGVSGLFAAGLMAGLVVLWRRDTEDAAALFAALLFAFATLACFDQEKISIVMIGAAGLSLAVSLVRSSYEMAYRDQLTGLLGRRALDERLKGLGGHYVIAMLDVDHFKKFNDTYGHDVGDDVLKMVARQIDRVGGGGTAYRYGGEEFSAVFAGKDIQECKPHLEAVRRAVGRYRLALRDPKGRKVSKEEAAERRGRRKRARDEKNASITISIGVAERSELHATADEVIQAADAALYRAKEKGRNCLSR